MDGNLDGSLNVISLGIEDGTVMGSQYVATNGFKIGFLEELIWVFLLDTLKYIILVGLIIVTNL